MNDQDRAEFDRITQLTPDSMTLHDKMVLQARRSYLGKRKTQEFADVLKEDLTVSEDNDSETNETENKVPGE